MGGVAEGRSRAEGPASETPVWGRRGRREGRPHRWDRWESGNEKPGRLRVPWVRGMSARRIRSTWPACCRHARSARATCKALSTSRHPRSLFVDRSRACKHFGRLQLRLTCSWPTPCRGARPPTRDMLAVRASHTSRPAGEAISGRPGPHRPHSPLGAGAAAAGAGTKAARLSTGPPCLHGFVCCKASAQGPGSPCVQQCSARALVLYSAVSVNQPLGCRADAACAGHAPVILGFVFCCQALLMGLPTAPGERSAHQGCRPCNLWLQPRPLSSRQALEYARSERYDVARRVFKRLCMSECPSFVKPWVSWAQVRLQGRVGLAAVGAAGGACHCGRVFCTMAEAANPCPTDANAAALGYTILAWPENIMLPCSHHLPAPLPPSSLNNRWRSGASRAATSGAGPRRAACCSRGWSATVTRRRCCRPGASSRCRWVLGQGHLLVWGEIGGCTGEACATAGHAAQRAQSWELH